MYTHTCTRTHTHVCTHTYTHTEKHTPPIGHASPVGGRVIEGGYSDVFRKRRPQAPVITFSCHTALQTSKHQVISKCQRAGQCYGKSKHIVLYS